MSSRDWNHNILPLTLRFLPWSLFLTLKPLACFFLTAVSSEYKQGRRGSFFSEATICVQSISTQCCVQAGERTENTIVWKRSVLWGNFMRSYSKAALTNGLLWWSSVRVLCQRRGSWALLDPTVGWLATGQPWGCHRLCHILLWRVQNGAGQEPLLAVCCKRLPYRGTHTQDPHSAAGLRLWSLSLGLQESHPLAGGSTCPWEVQSFSFFFLGK